MEDIGDGPIAAEEFYQPDSQSDYHFRLYESEQRTGDEGAETSGVPEVEKPYDVNDHDDGHDNSNNVYPHRLKVFMLHGKSSIFAAHIKCHERLQVICEHRFLAVWLFLRQINQEIMDDDFNEDDYVDPTPEEILDWMYADEDSRPEEDEY